ncbi:MAG: glycosyltransferase, partial [Chlamydiota bacterium]|nr:glycosyltransferase [Chlamydiota bacterium]
FTYSPCATNDKFVLLAGSAPWVKKQFRLKGIDLLLEAASKIKSLHLIFLWRGLLLDELKKGITHHGVEQKVEIINEKVDVNHILSKVHATIVLAENSKLVKAYPHSLIESLAAGKPVLISRTIPMSDYIQEKGFGSIIHEINFSNVLYAIQDMEKNYDSHINRVQQFDRSEFSIEKMVSSHKELYASIVK